MQAGGIIAAAEVVATEREVGKGVSAVDERLGAMFTGQRHDVADRQDVPREVHDVGDLDHPGPLRQRPAKPGDDVLGRRVRAAQGDPLHDHAVAAGTLIPRREHPRVALVGDDDLVAAFQIEAGDQRLHRLRGVAGDGHLLRVAAELPRQLAAHRLDKWFQDVPHVVSGRHVGEPQVADHRVEHGRRRGCDSAMVDIDQVEGWAGSLWGLPPRAPADPDLWGVWVGDHPGPTRPICSVNIR